ncbi:MAG: uroporphyrinogen methyltransferase / synthase [Solirubrobacteraceae bacterium]|jgi:uroporphyrinogen III methyltransferase/synthase|nr:uroporphyrinogen methyltransferase / synthase [Solirubrobacteraceae bacterium]
MTARSLELIAAADVVLYDRLIPHGALDGARADAELVYVGKEPGRPALAQEDIGALLVEHGRTGRRVVRLKGGDPFVFGRGGEEAAALRAAGIAYEVVPGVTAGVAAPAYAGIPVTHRDAASAVAFVTGHEDPEKEESALDWEALARFPGTLVFYMGVRRLPRIAEALIAAGRAADDPAAVVERGTLPGQRTVLATLSTIAQRVEQEGLRAPAITVVGPVAALREQLAWLEERPLHGRTVAVTRARAQASGLVAKLRGLGADVVEAPAIRIEPLPGEAPDLDGYDLVVFTSPNGVSLFFERLSDGGRDARALAGKTVAAIGPGTADALRERGIEPDVVPERSVAESLLEALEDVAVQRALVARAQEARDVLPDGLRERGAEVDVLELYRTVAEPLDGDAREAALGADWIAFTSASTVRYFLDAAGGQPPRGRIVSIGPVTSAALREHGLEPAVEAAEHDVDGLVAALLADTRA